MTPLWDTWAGIVIPMLLIEKHICTCLYWALDQIRRQYYVPPQLISLSQTSAIWEVPAACNLRLLVQWQPFPGGRWAINNFYIQKDLISSLCTKYCRWQDRGRRIPPLCWPTPRPWMHQTAPRLSALQLWRSLLLQDGHSSARAGPHRVILPSGGPTPSHTKGFTHVFQSLQLKAWQTNLNWQRFHFARINKTMDETVEEQVDSISRCPGGLLSQRNEVRRTAMCNCLVNAQHESPRSANHRPQTYRGCPSRAAPYHGPHGTASWLSHQLTSARVSEHGCRVRV